MLLLLFFSWLQDEAVLERSDSVLGRGIVLLYVRMASSGFRFLWRRLLRSSADDGSSLGRAMECRQVAGLRR